MFWYAKNIWTKRRVTRFYVESFLSHSAEKFQRGAPFSFEKFLVKEIFMHRTGGITVLSTFSVSQNQKISRGNSLVFQKRSDMEKQLWTRREGRGILRSSVGLCFDSRCRKVPKNIKGEPLSLFRKSFRNDKIHAKEGASASRFYRFFFVSKNRKISQGKSLVFQKYSEMEKIMDRKGGVVSRGSVRIFLSHSAEKTRTGTLFASEKFC